MRELLSKIARRHEAAVEGPTFCTVLDLGTEQVKGLVVELRGSECSVVGVGSASCHQAWCGIDGRVVDISRVRRSCDQALGRAEDMTARCCGTQVVPDWVVIGLPNCLTTAETFSVTHHRSDPSTRVTERELRELAERAQRLALRRLGGKMQSRHNPECTKARLVETSVCDLQVDGRSVTDPVGFRGEKLALTVFNVAVSSSYLRSVEEMAEGLGLEILMTSSGWQALASVVGAGESVAIDVGGRATDIAVVHTGRAQATASLPLGGGDFTEHLAEVLELPWREAERLKLAYSRGVIGIPVEAQAVMSRVTQAWLGAVSTLVGKLSGSHPVPHRFNLCGGGSKLLGIVESVRSHPWVEVFGVSRHPEVRLMEPRDIPHVLDRTGQLRGQQYVAPAALAAYVMLRDTQEDSLRSLLWQVKRPEVFVDSGEGA